MKDASAMLPAGFVIAQDQILLQKAAPLVFTPDLEKKRLKLLQREEEEKSGYSYQSTWDAPPTIWQKNELHATARRSDTP